MSRAKASLLVMIATVLYGLVSLLVKKAYQAGLSAELVIGMQTFVGVCCLWAMVLHDWKKILQAPYSTRFILFIGGAISSLTSVFYFQSLALLPASLAIILLFQFTWIGILLDALVKRKMPSPNQFISVLVILVGTILATDLSFVDLRDISIAGILFGLGSAIAYSILFFVSGNIANDLPSTVKTGWMSLGSFTIISILYPPIEAFQWGQMTSTIWTWGVIIGLCGIGIPYFLITTSVRYVGSGAASILGSFELPIVIIFSALFLHEEVTWARWIGILFILVGIVIAELKTFRKKPSSSVVSEKQMLKDSTPKAHSK